MKTKIKEKIGIATLKMQSNIARSLKENKKAVVTSFMLYACVCVIFAADQGALTKVISNVLAFFNSIYIRGIGTILIGIGLIGWWTNRGGEGVFKKFAPLVIIPALLMSLSAIAELIWGTDTSAITPATTFSISL